MNITRKPFESITEGRHFIIGCYTEMLTRIKEHELVPLINGQGAQPTLPDEDALPVEKIIQALSIYFQLMTLVEENAATQYRRKMENLETISSIRGSWAEAFNIWKEQGVHEEEMLQAIARTRVIPVLTAHPTEAKRVTVIEIHRELYLLLVQRETASLSKLEQNNLREKIIHLLERWWRTGEIYLEKPDIRDERANILHYLGRVFPTVLTKCDQQLKGSWIEMGFNPNTINNPDGYPSIAFGSWVGGDRDGHPFVTPGITQETLALHRTTALALIKNQLMILAAKLSVSAFRNPVPDLLSEAIATKQKYLGEPGENVVRRNPYEPWRQYVSLMVLQMENTISEKHADGHSQYRSYKTLSEDLKVLRVLLTENGMTGLAEDLLFPIERSVQCFGFHLAKLDIRQNSAFHDKAIAQILNINGEKEPDFENWSEKKRLQFLNNVLLSHSLITDSTVSY